MREKKYIGCIICDDKNMKLTKQEKIFCEECFPDTFVINLCKLAKRVKALEEKLK